MQVGMYYWKICGSGGHVYHENICHWRTCPVCGHVLQVCAEVATIVVVSVGTWCGAFFPVIFLNFFNFRHAFKGFII